MHPNRDTQAIVTSLGGIYTDLMGSLNTAMRDSYLLPCQTLFDVGGMFRCNMSKDVQFINYVTIDLPGRGLSFIISIKCSKSKLPKDLRGQSLRLNCEPKHVD